MQDLSDEELVARFRAETESKRAETWINELFRRYHSRVATWCLRFTGDRESAADLAQDVFLRAYRNITSFRGDAKFSTWLFSVARNHCINEMKARSTRPEVVADAFTLDIEPARDENIHTTLENAQTLQSMRELVETTLDDTEKKVLTLHYAEEFTLDAITRLLGLTNASGAKAYVVSARRKLSTAVERWRRGAVRGTDSSR